MASFRFLHLSDLHFKINNPKNRQEDMLAIEEKSIAAREALATFICDEKMRLSVAPDGSIFDYVFISGDVAYQATYPSKGEFATDRLISALKMSVPQDGKERIFWAVGNHDLDNNPSQLLEQYKKHYWDVTSVPIDNNPDSMHWLKIKKDFFNLLILNTNTKSSDEDKIDVIKSTDGDGQIRFKMSSIRDLLAKRDSILPTIVIGHHGMSWFSFETKTDISKLFDTNNVDFYLCGHDHRLGYARFDDGQKDIHQITCGGCLHDGYSVFSIVYGEYRNGLYHLIPYVYNFNGSSNWGSSDQLHRKLGKENVFMRADYEDMVRKCFFQLWEKDIDFDQTRIIELWKKIWFACLELLKNLNVEISKEEFATKVADIVFQNVFAVSTNKQTAHSKNKA